MPRSTYARVVKGFSGLSLTTKGILAAALPVCALLAAIMVFYQFERQTQDARQWVEHSVDVRAEIRTITLLLANSDAGMRGYLLTRRDGFLQPYRAARRDMPVRLASLQRLVADNPGQRERLGSTRADVARALDSMEALRQAATANRTADEVAKLESSKTVMDRLAGELTAMAEAEQRLLAQRMQEERADLGRLELAILMGGGLGLLGGILAALLFTIGTASRVRQLEADARLVAKGIPLTAAVSGRDEIGRLGQTLRETSQLLAEMSAETRAAHRELEARVEQRTAELRDANEELRKANEIRQAVVCASPLAIWAVDLEGRVRFWNPAAEHMFGWSAAEVINRPLPVIPEDQREEHQQWLQRFRAGELLVGVEHKRQRKDGSQIDVNIWTAPLRDAGGRIVGTIAIDSDVTDRNRLEEQFRQSQKLEAVGRLAGGVAHDFNNLLTVIMGYVEMLLEEAKGSPSLLEYGSEIQYAAKRAGGLTAQLLAFSRRQISRPRVLDLNELVDRSMKMLQRMIGEDIEISLHLAPDLGRVTADPNHVDQLIMNLVVNARDAMSRGGKLTIETANTLLDDQFAGRHIGVKSGSYSMLAISDTGTGMTADVRSRLFEPFFTTKEAGKGTGLGLSIVYGIVKQNCGEVMVYSEPGKGTTFKIYLPVAAMPAESSGADKEPAELRGTETVLLCEDEAVIRKLVLAMLAKQGYRVLEAETPERAEQVAHDHAGVIDVLLTDVVMPLSNGFELAKKVLAVRPKIKVLYMSGYTEQRVGSGWMLEPGTPFLHKPFTAATLGHKLREALGPAAAGSAD